MNMWTLRRLVVLLPLALLACARLDSRAQKADEPAPAPKQTDLYGDPLPEGAKARMGTIRWRSGGAVYFVGFTTDARELVTASLDGSVRVWDRATGKPLRRLGADPKEPVLF